MTPRIIELEDLGKLRVSARPGMVLGVVMIGLIPVRQIRVTPEWAEAAADALREAAAAARSEQPG